MAGFVLVWWLLPPALYGRVAAEDFRVKAITDTRTALLAGLLGIGAIATFLLNSRVHKLTEQGHITDRYGRAIEQLGSTRLDVRLGGIYALERIAVDSARDHPTVVEVLSAFVREHSNPARRSRRRAAAPGDHPRPTADVQAAVTVLGRLPAREGVARAQLAAVNLSGAVLRETNLSGADVDGANLSGAHLFGANLSGAHLGRANLSGAHLGRANLSGAHLFGANLSGAHLFGANLSGAHLDETNLSGADLFTADVSGAHLDKADLSDAKLNHADLSSASLNDASLTGANINRANLTRAFLIAANLSGANLDWANLTRAILGEANLSGAHLNGADLTGAFLVRAKPPGRRKFESGSARLRPGRCADSTAGGAATAVQLGG